MRYLITGGAGFIGSHLVDELVARDLGEVIILDNFSRGSRLNIAKHLETNRIQLVEADVRNFESLSAELRGIDVVFHLAAQSSVIGAGRDLQYSCATNVLGTMNVLRAAHEQGVTKVVFTSSREVYGESEEIPVYETAALTPKNVYGASKVAGEMYCRAFQAMGLDVSILRLSNVYGPRDRDRVIPVWLDRASHGLDLEIFGGQQVIDLIAVDFVVEALIRAAGSPGLSGPVNVGSGKGTALIELARRIIQLTGSPSRTVCLPARSEEVCRYVAAVDGMQRHLGLRPPGDPLASILSTISQSRTATAIAG